MNIKSEKSIKEATTNSIKSSKKIRDLIKAPSK